MQITAAAFVLLAMAMIGDDKPKKDDAEAIKGNWAAVSIKSGDQEAPPDDVKAFKLSFDAKTYVNTIGDRAVEEGTFTIDPAKSPKTLDLEIKKGPEEGKKQLAIYELDGDKLTVVLAMPGATERPKSIKPGGDENVIIAVFERSKG